MRTLSILLVSFLLVTEGPYFASCARAERLDMRELSGETLYYTVYWSGIPAAEASLSADFIAPDRMRFTTRATSFSAVSLIYPVKNQIVSVVLLPMIRPLEYSKKGQEGWGNMQNKRVVFDYQALESRFFRDEDLKKTLPITIDIQDPLSCLYYYRAAELVEGDALPLVFADGNKVVPSSARIVGREKITVPAGTFDTIIVNANMEKVGGIFAKSPGSPLLVWLSADKWKRPVKLQSKVRIGEFTAVLEKIDPPTLSRPEPSTDP